jgi:hypothetical protein
MPVWLPAPLELNEQGLWIGVLLGEGEEKVRGLICFLLTNVLVSVLTAFCGMNCGVCVSYLAMKNDLNKQGFKKAYCEGCLPRGKNCLHMGDRCEFLGKGLI